MGELIPTRVLLPNRDPTEEARTRVMDEFYFQQVFRSISGCRPR